MNVTQELQLGYVLHSRAYRETSLLLDVLTAEHGRIALVARGAKRGQGKGKSSNSAVLQPFIPLNIGWFGSGELVTLTTVEAVRPMHDLTMKRVICGLYINELLAKLLPKWDPCAELFAAYEGLLSELCAPQQLEQAALRKFEKQLLKSIGYGLQLTTDIVSEETIDPQQYYVLDPVMGPSLANERHLNAILGSSLLAFAADDYTEAVLPDLRRLMRNVLGHHLGHQTLMTRQLL